MVPSAINYDVRSPTLGDEKEKDYSSAGPSPSPSFSRLRPDSLESLRSLPLSLSISFTASLFLLLSPTRIHIWPLPPPCSSPHRWRLRIQDPPRRSLPLGAPSLLSGGPPSQLSVQICWSEHNRRPSRCNPKTCHHPSKHGPKSAVDGGALSPSLLCLDAWASRSTATSTHKNRYASKWQHCSQTLRYEQIRVDYVAALLLGSKGMHCSVLDVL
ncbi:uncharacterized protein LOC110437619 [Sorghum bicolor]|uniref:uncharacterized protein LOC110437619 n=1 Tax=Sorghum bicolor TaxID=4558 RepID=UPI000B426CE1|nr:uncharacterized protein LOC110437619 [Sorghum bicolor]|eukprot:XP_021321782.1 uncharacterized protein LOC110437619 [Sorghum bicolor]